MESVSYSVPRVLEPEPGNLADCLLRIEKPERVAGDSLEVLICEKRVSVEASYACNGHIAESIMVRSIEPV